PPPRDLAAGGREAEGQRNTSLIDRKQMSKVAVESSGDRVVHSEVRIVEDAKTLTIEAVDIVLGKVADPGPDKASVEKLAQALIGSPPRAPEDEPCQLCCCEEPHLAQALDDPAIAILKAERPGLTVPDRSRLAHACHGHPYPKSM